MNKISQTERKILFCHLNPTFSEAHIYFSLYWDTIFLTASKERYPVLMVAHLLLYFISLSGKCCNYYDFYLFLRYSLVCDPLEQLRAWYQVSGSLFLTLHLRQTKINKCEQPYRGDSRIWLLWLIWSPFPSPNLTLFFPLLFGLQSGHPPMIVILCVIQ